MSESEAEAAVLAHVDHIVYGTRDFEATLADLERVLGVRASFGGRHPGAGTQNALLSLGPGRYLEVITPDPEQPDPPGGRSFGLDGLTEPGIIAWVARADDLQGLLAKAGRQEIDLGAVRQGSRRRPDGAPLSWRFTDPRVSIADRIVPAFIDWGVSPHPSADAPAGATLIGFRAEHPQADPVRKLLEVLELPLRVDSGPAPALIATLATPRGEVELR